MIRVVVSLVFVLFVTLSSSLLAVDWDAKVEEAKALAKSGNLQQAKDICQSVIDAHPGLPVEPKARLVMGYLLIKENAPTAKVAEQFSFAADAFPGTKEAAESLHCLGHLSLREGDPILAIKKFEEAAAVPEATKEMVEDSLVQCGYACISQYWKTGDRAILTKAARRFAKVKNKPVTHNESVRAGLGLGEILLIQGLGKEAAAEYQDVLDMNPKHPYLKGVAEFELGCALYSDQDWTGAMAAFDRFLSARPGQDLREKDRQWKVLKPGYAAMAISNPEGAKKLSGIELVPEALYWKAYALYRLGRPGDALNLADQISNVFPEAAVASRAQKLAEDCASYMGR